MGTTMMDETGARCCAELDWQGVDARLRDLAARAAAHEWELGRVLLRARETRAHERLGIASLFEYIDRLFGYSPRMVAERLRVADALTELPALAAALREGELSWSAVREVTRVATPETEREWLDYAARKTVRELEHAVSGLRAGDRPGDPPDPHLERRVLRLEVSPEAFALFKDAMARLRRETDAALTEEDALAELCRRALRSGADVAGSPYQIALTVCEHCGRTWHETGGESVELPAEVGERAACDAQLIRVESWDTHVGAEDAGAVTHVGAASEAARSATHVGAASTEAARSATHVGAASGGATGSGTHVGAASGEATGSGTHVGAASGGAARSATHLGRRATRTIPPATRRLVVRRDRGKCRVPGCRSGWLDVHHLRPRAEGGTHHPSGLILLCGGHHALHHRGLLVIDGATESEARFSHADGTPYGAAPRPAQVEASAEAYAALRSLGFRETESRTALAAARTHVGAEATAEELVRAALRARAAA